MPRSRVIDPITRDYVQEGGGRKYTRTIATKLHHAVRAHRGEWTGDPDRGSTYHLIARGNIDKTTAARAENALKLAVQPFVDEGLAKDLEVQVDVGDGAAGRVFAETAITDTQAGTIDLVDVVRFTE